MSVNFYEEELRKELRKEIESGDVLIIENSLSLFDKLSNNYPVLGSKIDWDSIPGVVERVETDQSIQFNSFAAFFEEMVGRFCLSGDITYAGDGLIDFALFGEVQVFKKILSELFSIPQHHYFWGSEFSWCICCTMEGDMAFGFSPFTKNN